MRVFSGNFVPLSIKLNAPLIVISLVVLLTFVIYENIKSDERINRQINTETAHVENTLIITTENSIHQKKISRIVSILSAKESIIRISLVHNDKGIIIADNDLSNLGENINNTLDNRQRGLVSQFLASGEKILNIDDESYVYHFKILNLVDPEVNRFRPYYIFLIYDKVPALYKENIHFYRSLFVYTISLVIMVFTGVYLQRNFVIKPLRNITSILDRQKDFDKYIPLPSETNDEIGLLTNQYNKVNREKYERDKELKAARHHIDGITHEVPFLLAYIDSHQIYRFVNQRYENWLGLKKSDIIGCHIKDIIGADTYEDIRQHIDRTLTGQVVIAESRMHTQDKGERVIKAYLSPDIKDTYEATGLFICIEDITEEHITKGKLERYMSDLEFQAWALEEAKDQALDAAKGKANFLATMSHEIRTPMNGVLGMAELLSETRLDDIQKDYINTILSSGKLLLTIINDVLDYSKLEAGKVEMEHKPFNLEHLIHSVLDLMGQSLKKDIKLILDYPARFPRGFIGDSARMHQVLFNLVGNAIKFTESGHIIVKVIVDEEDTLFIDVIDTGIGMTETQQQSLFESFSQADTSTTRKYGGTGLGLSITKKLIELQSGSISVLSEAGKGSTFSIELCLPIEGTRYQANIDLPDNLFVVLVDHEKHNQRIFDDLLRHHNIDIAHATQNSIEQILSSMSADKQLVLLWDLENNAADYAKCLSTWNATHAIKSIALLSKVSAQKTAELEAMGFNSFLKKPLSHDIALGVIAKVLGHQTAIPTTQAIINDALDTPNEQHIFTGKVLLVEDVLTNQKIASIVLKQFGLEIDIANDGLEAIACYEKNNYDLILMDCRMPNMDGYEATRQIRLKTDGQKTPIIALTANATEEDRSACYSVGMNDVVTKPFNKQDLLPMLNKYLNGEKPEQKNNAVNATPASNAPVIDDTTFDALHNALQDAFAEVVMSVFELGEQVFAGFDKWHEASDMEELVRLPHSLKSVSASIGALHLSELAMQCEKLASEGDVDQAMALVTDMKAAYQTLVDALEQRGFKPA